MDLGEYPTHSKQGTNFEKLHMNAGLKKFKVTLSEDSLLAQSILNGYECGNWRAVGIGTWRPDLES